MIPGVWIQENIRQFQYEGRGEDERVAVATVFLEGNVRLLTLHDKDMHCSVFLIVYLPTIQETPPEVSLHTYPHGHPRLPHMYCPLYPIVHMVEYLWKRVEVYIGIS